MKDRIINVCLLVIIIITIASCKKEHNEPTPSPTPPPVPEKHILLKDITELNLPAPYYHFEYNTDSIVTKADFASGYTQYDIVYNGGKIAEMRNNIIVNHDTLRYVYDNSGKLAMLKFINTDNVIYRLVFFRYEHDQIKEIEWDQKVADVGYIIDRTLNFTYFPDGNVKTISEHRPPANGVPDYVSVKSFDQYDDKINVDDFSLVHDGIHDHLFLLQGFRLQKNNPKIENLSVNGVDLYHIDYTYTYNADQTPSVKSGDFIYLSGDHAGERFRTNSTFTYY